MLTCVLLTAVLAGLTAFQLQPTFELLQPFASDPVADAGPCTVLGEDTIFSSEDLTILRDGIALASAGDFGTSYFSRVPDGDLWASNVAEGKVWAVDFRQREAVPLPVDGLPKTLRFQPHGFFLSNSTTLGEEPRLFAVSHGAAAGGGERVVVFRVQGTALHDLRLQYEVSITSPNFFALALNDVVHGHGNEIFATKWLRAPAGKEGPRFYKGWEETKNHLIQESLYLDVNQRFPQPGTSEVLRCVWDDPPPGETAVEARCEVAAGGFASANGITISPDRRLLFANDLPLKQVRVYRIDRRDDGTVALVEAASRMALPAVVDNLEYDAGSATITMGGVPSVWTAFQAMKDSHIIDGTSFSARTSIPGSLVVVKTDPGEAADPDAWAEAPVTTALTEDGTLMSQVSSAVLVDGGALAILGTPWGVGVLLCEVPQV